MTLTYPRRLAPGVERVVGTDALVEVGMDGSIAVLRSERGTRDIAILHQRPPDTEPLLALADRLAWLDGRVHAPRILAAGRAVEGDEAVVICLHAAAATADSGLHPLQPAVVVTRLGEVLREIHNVPATDVPFDSSPARLRDLAAARVERALITTAGDGPYATRDPAELLSILDSLLAELDPDLEEPVLIHGRPTVANIWFEPSGDLVLTGWTVAGVGDRHHDLAVAAASVADLYGPGVVAPMLDTYGLDVIDLSRLDAHQLLAHLLG